MQYHEDHFGAHAGMLASGQVVSTEFRFRFHFPEYAAHARGVRARCTRRNHVVEKAIVIRRSGELRFVLRGKKIRRFDNRLILRS